MDSMDNVRERIEALEQRTEPVQHQPRALEAHTHTVKRRLRRWRSPWCVAVAALGLAVALPLPVQAKTFRCSAGDVQCLIDAINTANANGETNTIRLEAGPYTLTAIDNGTTGDTNGLPVITSPLTIRGAGAAATVIERDASAPEFRLLASRPPGVLTLQGLTLRGGRLLVRRPLPFPFSDPEGGGISNSGTLTLSDCTLTENESITGLAIFNSGTVTITKSRITNHSGGFSGVIVNSGTLTITKSHITDNFSDAQSAGITNDGGTVTITESTIAYNIGAHGSGGLSNIAGTVVIATTTFADNLADGAASAIHNAGTLTITDSSLTDNGIFGIATGTMTNVGMLKVTNTTFARNFAPGISSEHGVAIANYHTLILTNSTLADNVEGAFRSGSAALLSASGATTLLQNTLLARNVGSGIAGSGSDCSGVVTSLGHNLIGDPTGCTITLHPSDLTGDPGFATFTDDGTPGNGHVPLLPTSQAIDAGNDLVCPRRDQIGQRRVNIPGVGTSRCDIGAIEFPGKDDRQHDQDLAATAQGSQ